jgi:type I restriction enzyme S subunit
MTIMAIDNKDKKVLKSSIEREQNEPACSAEREKIKGSKNLNVPHLRFPEFSGEWDSFKLVELGKFIGGGTPSSSNLSFWTGSIPWISSSDIKEDNINNISISRYITEDAIEKSATKYCPAPVILIVSRVGVGKVALSHTSLCTSQDFCNIIEIKCHPVFLSYNLLRTMKRKSREVQGTSIKGITSDELQKIRVFIPKNKDEQNKISNLLTLLDERIATQNKIIEDLKKLKSAISERLFKGIEGSFVLLSDICDIVKGKQINGENLSESGNYYVMNGGTEPSGYYSDYNVEANSISISEGGNSCGYVQFNTLPFWSGGHCYSIQNIADNVNNLYLYHYLKSNEDVIMKLRIGSGLPNIQKKDLAMFKIIVPKIERQITISTFLSSLERKVEIEERIQNAMLKEKLYLLQQMFI